MEYTRGRWRILVMRILIMRITSTAGRTREEKDVEEIRFAGVDDRTGATCARDSGPQRLKVASQKQF
jgi:hypothetical protein